VAGFGKFWAHFAQRNFITDRGAYATVIFGHF